MKQPSSPIIKKILLFGMLSGAISLLLACLGFGIVEFYKIKNESLIKLNSQADILTYNLEPTLLFEDKDAADNILRSLQGDQSVTKINVYTVDKDKFTLFAAFVRSEESGNIRLRKDISRDGKKIGWLEIESVYAGLMERYLVYLFVCLVIILISIPCLYIISAPLRQQVSNSVVQMLETTEALKRSNQDLEEFAYVTSHDLKAPLRGIASLAEWLASDYKDKIDAAGQEQLGLLLKRVRRMHHLIDAILQYSKIGRTKEEKTEVDLAKVVKDVVDSLGVPGHIVVGIDSHLPVITTQAVQIEQVFQNLLSNAVRYCDKPKGEINIRCEEAGAFWTFSISDNGPGIEEKYYDKIFKIFQTLGANEETGSTGVGLAIVKKIIDRSGGRVWIESKLGHGTTFYFNLPRTK
ncbi:MAG: ATP-binding protein [Candidatus Omnitrophota bacterium]